MAKFQLERVQREPPRRIGLRPVLAIAGDRMAERGQLHADLVAAPGFERALEQRSIALRAQDAVVRGRQLAALRDATNYHRLALEQPVPERPLLLGRHTFDD